jgi:heme A synthase
MTLWMLIVLLVCIGVLIWAARKFIADPLLQKLAVIVLVVAGVFIVLNAVGILDILKAMPTPHV